MNTNLSMNDLECYENITCQKGAMKVQVAKFMGAFRVAILGMGVTALSSSSCFAFWGFSQAEPEVIVAYNRAECLPSGGIKLTVRNPSDEPLAEVQGTVKIYRPETSRLGADIDFWSDRVIGPNSAMAFCVGVSRENVLGVLSAKEPGASAQQIMNKYGFDYFSQFGVGDLNVDPDAYLKDSIMKFEIKSFKYGLPY